MREAAWQAELEALAVEHKKRAVEQKKLHAAQVRRQKELLRSIGVPDLTPEEVMERPRRRFRATLFVFAADRARAGQESVSHDSFGVNQSQ